MRAQRSGRTFSFVDEREREMKKKEEREEGETRPAREREGCNGAHIIMDPAIEKSETSRREVHERRRVRTYVRIYEYVRVYVHTSEPGRATCSVMSYFVPRRTAHGDYRLTITSVSGIPVSPSFITTYRSPTDYA